MSTTTVPSILLVEDDLRLAELVSRYLESNGFSVTIISNGDEVVARVEHDPPDLVILDLGLPGEDGLSICRHLRPAYSSPILILTARDSNIDHVLGLELGADDYVIKPVEPRVLLAGINALLRRSLEMRMSNILSVPSYSRLKRSLKSASRDWIWPAWEAR